MSCDKVYQEECCCECDFQLEIQKFAKGFWEETEGYICIAFRESSSDLRDRYVCYHTKNKHGACELFMRKGE